jgi:cytoskeletal protein RodZ
MGQPAVDGSNVIRPAGTREKEDDMTETTPLGLIIIAIVTVIVLAAWIALVFYADAHPAWRRHEPPGHDTAGQAARITARRHQDNVDDASHQTQESTTARPDVGAPTERAAGIAPDKASAG